MGTVAEVRGERHVHVDVGLTVDYHPVAVVKAVLGEVLPAQFGDVLAVGNDMPDVDGNGPYSVPSWTLLEYADNNQWSREEDTYNPDAMLKMLRRWCDAQASRSPPPKSTLDQVGGVGAVVRSPGQIAQPVDAVLLVTPQPPVVDLATDPVIPARHRDVAGHFLGVLDDRQPATDLSGQLRFAHASLPVIGDPDCQRCPSVLEV
jgi:hypothetical protein